MPLEGEHLDAAIPVTRPSVAAGPSRMITYGNYLAAVQQFVIGHWDLLVEILARHCFPAAIESVDIIAEKHGSDYHPARVEVRARGVRACFAVNVALSDRGKTRLRNEFKTAKLLHEKFRADFIPKPYCLGQQAINQRTPDDSGALMLLGEWFEGYHEFHLSLDGRNASRETALWDLDLGYTFLSLAESSQIYSKASFILTFYYDIETFEEIFPWHHAAGDFVARDTKGTIDVKLIATRQYAARVGFLEDSPENRVLSLILFLANLTVRMRLDRLDGVGEVVWAGETCVEDTIRGFFDAMRRKVAEGFCDQTTWNEFIKALKEFSPAEWAQIFQAVVDSYHCAAPDLAVIMDNLAAHILRVYRAVQAFSQG